MLTATEISEKTRLPLYTVGYRLKALKRTNRIKPLRKIGNAWIYPVEAVELVKNFKK